MRTGLLIASPQMHDPYFERAVVLLCQHDADGAIGLVINRDGPVKMGAVLDGLDLEVAGHEEEPTWWGGPVDRGTGFVVWRGRAAQQDGWTLAGEIAVSRSVERLTALVEGGQPFHLCLGYAGWTSAQLEAEIARGSWLYTDPDPEIVFEVPLGERYDRALALLGLTSATVWMQPINE